MKGFRVSRFGFAIVSLWLSSAIVSGQDSAQPPALTPPPASPLRTVSLPEPQIEGSAAEQLQAAPFAASLRSSFASAISAYGFALAEQDGEAAWLARISVSVASERLAYHIAVYGMDGSELVAADSFSSYAGPTAFPLIDDSAHRAASQLAAFVDKAAGLPRRPVPYRIAVSSVDEGATVSLGPPEAPSSIVAGTIKDRSLLLPYYPFARGSTISLFVSAPGRRTERIEVQLGDLAPRVNAPALAKASSQDLLVGTGTGRLLGAGFGYRRYFVPDWTFLFAYDNLFAGYDFLPGSAPLLHEELWTGLGSFLVLPRESRFRFGAGLGLGYLLSLSTQPQAEQSVYFDFAFLPVYLFFEYRLGSDRAIWLSISSSYALNTGPNGLLPQGWMNRGTPALAAGLLWRR